MKEAVQRAGWEMDDVDAFVFHQANFYIMRNLARLLKIPMEKCPVSLDEFGNTSSVSIPLTMVSRMKNILEHKTKIVFVGFGVGLSWSAVTLEWKDGILCPLVELEC